MAASTDNADHQLAVGAQGATAGAGSHAEFRRVAAPDRTTFYDEQRRRRRATWRLSLVCLVIALVLGLVLSTILSPLILAIVVGALKLAAHVGCPPDICTEATHRIAGWVSHESRVMRWVLGVWPLAQTPAQKWIVLQYLLGSCTLLLPGMAAMAIAWLALRATQVRAGMIDLVGAANARPPRRDDLEERQLANVVEEIALAAGIPTPRLMIIDAPAANAAAVGASYRTATVLVTRGLLDLLDRDETEAVVAHAVASIGNGDLKVMQSLIALFQTFGLFHTILDLPFGISAWRALGGFLSAIADPHLSPAARQTALQGIEDSLSGDEPPINFMMFPLLPLKLITLFQKLMMILWIVCILGWPLALLWRSRRYLADSSAVALTRNPDALASALTRLATGGGVPPGGEHRAYLFVCAGGASGVARSGQPGKSPFADRHSIPLALHPPIERRVRRLVALGASPSRLPPSRLPSLARLARTMTLMDMLKLVASVPLVLLCIALLLLIAVMMIAGLGGLVFLTLFTTIFSLMLGLGFFALVLWL